MFHIFEKYNHQPLLYGKYDCTLMVLEAVGADISGLTYKTIRGGKTQLTKKFKQNSVGSYLQSIGYSLVQPTFIRDYDIVITGIHCAIYFDGCLFGYYMEDNMFKFKKVSISYLKDSNAEVYSWLN